MTKKEAFKLTYECWVWLSENPRKKKKDWVKFELLRAIGCTCAFCEYHKGCYTCYLFLKTGFICDNDDKSLWKIHHCAEDEAATKEAAKKIAELTKEYMIKEGLWDD